MAVRFDQASDRITFTGSVPDPASGFTLTMWAMPIVDTNDYSTMARLHVVAGDATTVTFSSDNDGLAGPAYFTAGGSIIHPTGTALNQWRKLACACLGTGGQVYVSTEAGPTVLASGTVIGNANPTAITFGGRSAGDAVERFDGRIAYARLFNARLTQTQIEAEWASAVPITTGSLFADWPLATASDLTDHSGNGHHLVAGSTAVTTEAGPNLGANVTGSATLTFGGLLLNAVGVRSTFGSAQINLGQLQLTAQTAQRRIKLSGREPGQHVVGARPTTHISGRE